jgi:hypothetical protein
VKYDYLPVLDKEKEKYEDHQELVTPLQSPMNSNSPLSSSSSKSSSSDNPPNPQRKMKSLDYLYEVTNPIDSIDNDLTLYYHLAMCELIAFEEAIKDEKWRITMDEEIASIKKNDVWKLNPGPRKRSQ